MSTFLGPQTTDLRLPYPVTPSQPRDCGWSFPPVGFVRKKMSAGESSVLVDQETRSKLVNFYDCVTKQLR
jgi:hypothetical protein